jgi:predicted GH43/DUF377 family glycosyl hydrolase
MRPEARNPHEAWGVLNPGGVRSTDGAMHLFPRLIAEGNYSRIGHVRVRFDDDRPTSVERLGLALAPHERYEVNAGGGGVEDARVVYVPLLALFVMVYTAFVPNEPRIAVAVSEDLTAWRRLGLVSYEAMEGEPDLNRCGNKDAAMIPDVVADPQGIPSLAILHRPTTRVHRTGNGAAVTHPPSGDETREQIWISYIPAAVAKADVAALTHLRRHERVMGPEQPWEASKIGTGAPPTRLAYGWVLPYHGVAAPHGTPRYCMGVAVLDAERPSRVLFRAAAPILEPETTDERNGLVDDVVFPSASDLRADGTLDVYYGAADHVVAVARVTLPPTLPAPANDA